MSKLCNLFFDAQTDVNTSRFEVLVHSFQTV
uniref:Uncharacterized protein n=1 Tax=Arundo donax TaxID=35708 RepID=A0A0A9GFL5_ARUDO